MTVKFSMRASTGQNLTWGAGFGKMVFCTGGQVNAALDGTRRLVQTANEDLQILRALCQTKDAGLRRRACKILSNHEWVEGEHRVIFEVCAAIDSYGARIDFATLAAQMTRAGFPDVDFDALFDPLPMPDAELAKRLNALEENAR